MHGKLYNPIQSHIILLLLAHAYAGVTSLPTSSTAVRYNDVENRIRTGLASQFTHGFDRLQVLTSPWSPSTSSRSTAQTMGESHPQSPLKHLRRCPVANRAHETPACGGLVPVTTTPDQAQVHSATSEVATLEQLSSLNTPQATPLPAAAELTTSNNNAAQPTKLPGNTASVPTDKPNQPTALDSAVKPSNLAPVISFQVSAVLQQSTTYPPESSNDIPDSMTLVPAPGKTKQANTRGATSPAIPAPNEERTSVGMPGSPETSLSPTSEHTFAVPGTEQHSMSSTVIPTTAPDTLAVPGPAHIAHAASQRVENSQTVDSPDAAKDSGGILNTNTSGQKLSTAANTIAKLTALSRQSPLLSSIYLGANRAIVSAGSTAGSQISSSGGASLSFPLNTTATSPATIPTTAPAILTVLSSAPNAHPAWQGIGNGRRLNSSDIARDSSTISSINNGTSGQKSSTAANTTANVTALSRPSLGVSSTSIVANSTTVSTGSTVSSQITSRSNTSLSSVGTITTSPATVRSSSSASGLQFKEAGSRLRGLEMIWLLGYLTGCIMVGVRVLV